MNKGRRIGAVVAATVAAVGMSSVGTVAPAVAAGNGPRPVSNWLRAVRANTPTWVNVYWRTDRRVCDAEVRVSGARVRVDYPWHRNYTSFSRGDNLWPGRTDYTAVQVTPYFNRAGIAVLRATISYDDCRPHGFTRRSSTVLTLPVIRNGWNNGGGTWDDHNGNGNGGWDGNDHHGNGNGGWDGNDHHGNGGWDGNDHHGPRPTQPTTTPTTSPATQPAS